MPAPSRKSPASAPPDRRTGLKLRDGGILAAACGLALLMMVQSGFKRGVELMPWPDGLEYAAAALNLGQGRGDVLHFAGYSYPSRYTEGYPLILAVAYRLVGHDLAKLADTSAAIGLFAIIALYVLTLELFGRPSAIIASSLLAISPIMITYSTLVLSDVPTLAITIVAAFVLARATFAEEASASGSGRGALLAHWAIFGFLTGFTVMMRPSNATMLLGVAVALILVPVVTDPRDTAALIASFAAGFFPMQLWQAHENLAHLGGVFASGYSYWVPEVYGSFSRTFNTGYLFGPTMPRNPHGNLPVYLLTLCGLDGLIEGPGSARFYLYPFAAAAFAAIGIVLASRSASRAVRRTVCFGLGFLVSLLALYLFYVFTEVAFLLPGCAILLALAGYGAASANRALAALWSKRHRSTREHSIVAGVAILDLLLAMSIAGEIVSRLSVTPRESEVVPALATLDRRIEPNATVVSNISIQFLELYVPGSRRDFVGLHSFDPGRDFTDYHLGRLYVKRSQGWRGPVPPVLFDGAGVVSATADALAASARSGRPVYLLLWMSPSPDYADVLKEELDLIGDRFSTDEVARTGPLALYRLHPG